MQDIRQERAPRVQLVQHDGDGLQRHFRQFRDDVAEPRQAIDFRVAVELGGPLPGVVERQLAPGHAPGRLPLVAPGGAPLGDLVGDQACPLAACRGVEMIGQGVQPPAGSRPRGGFGFAQALKVLPEHGGRARAGDGLIQKFERLRQVGIGHPSPCKLFGVEARRHQHVAMTDTTDQIRCLPKIVVGQAQEGIHGHEMPQGPEWRDPAGRRVQGVFQVRPGPAYGFMPGSLRPAGLDGMRLPELGGNDGHGDSYVSVGLRMTGGGPAALQQAVGQRADIEPVEEMHIGGLPETAGGSARKADLHQ